MVLNTVLYEKNFLDILNHQSFFFNFKNDIITKKVLTINNVLDPNLLIDALESTKENFGYEFDYFFVEDYEKEAIEFFNLDIDKKKTKGYHYIMPYFSLMMYLKSGFVFNVSSDCSKKINVNESFLKSSIKLIDKNKKVPLTTLSWELPKELNSVGEWEQQQTFLYKKKSEKNLKNFWYSSGFTDQVFIANIDMLKKIDYNILTNENPIYKGPSYCPNSWEKRVAEYMYKNNLYRGIFKDNKQYYIHPGHSL
jgi:hypothetical protein